MSNPKVTADADWYLGARGQTIDDLDTAAGVADGKLDQLTLDVADVDTAVGVTDGKADQLLLDVADVAADAGDAKTAAEAAQSAAVAAEGYTEKLDDAATLGLLGTDNSLAYRVNEIERHFHSNERWASKLAAPAGNRVTEQAMTPFTIVSGNNAYGAATQIMDIGDCEGLFPGAVHFDLHRIFVSDADHTTPYRIRLSYGTGTQPDAITAGQYSTVMWRSDNANFDRGPLDIMMRRIDAASKVWVQIWNATNESEMDMFFGVHFYEG